MELERLSLPCNAAEMGGQRLKLKCVRACVCETVCVRVRGCHRACSMPRVGSAHDSGAAAATGASLLSGQSEVEWLMDVPLKDLGPSSCVCVYVRAFGLPVVADGTGSNEAAAPVA